MTQSRDDRHPNVPDSSVDLASNPEKQNQDESSQDVCIAEMVNDLSVTLDKAIHKIHAVNSETRILALNARIEASRAGQHGAAFGVVAAEMQNLSDKTSSIAHHMASRTRGRTRELVEMINSSIRGIRLSDLALVNIDLIDRNLYERTCDVRWWATDGSLVDVLSNPTPESVKFASKRLGVILDAYTVYHDLVLCDHSGTIIANGRPEQFPSIGKSQANEKWFSRVMQTASGDEYGFQSAHLSPLVNDKPTLTYACTVREQGESQGRAIGALGILFDWCGLASPILEDIPVRESEKETTEAYIINSQGRILASNQGASIGQDLRLPELSKVLNCPSGFYVTHFKDQPVCIGHAKAPGFETYSTGWYSIVLQPLR